MNSNDEHIPANWGASVREKVLSVPAKTIKGIRDRAFKVSNELIRAYDQVSETGRALRDIWWPFYSWKEVNAKRYYRLIKVVSRICLQRENAHLKRKDESYERIREIGSG